MPPPLVAATSAAPSPSSSSALRADSADDARDPPCPHHASSPSSSSPARRRRTATCARCAAPITRQCVRALAAVFHPACFVCSDCHAPVAPKFFPFPPPPGLSGDHSDPSSPPPRVLCETDYFRRLGLLCAACGRALRARYVTALGRKYHVEHFTCSLCATHFGPGDSYYEHDGHIVCSFHYSTRYATPCTGCRTAILTQFVEINRSNVDEHWHPQCYMVSKFWAVTLAPSGEPSSYSSDDMEANETPESLAGKQSQMEDRVYRIWTVLSAFEERSAAAISAMLRLVSHGQYLSAMQAAQSFIVHVEVLFACLDKIDAAEVEAVQGLHIPQAKLLSKKIVTFLSLLSPHPKVKPTAALLSAQVSGMAHDLKMILRIALLSTIQLERDYDRPQPLQDLLDLLSKLARKDAAEDSPLPGGYTSIPRGGLGRKRSPALSLSDLCQHCGLSVEETCWRVGVTHRWHATCLQCTRCERAPTPLLPREAFRAAPSGRKRARLYCPECQTAESRSAETLSSVTLLEQYAYLLRVALDRLYALLKQRGQISEPSSMRPSPATELHASPSRTSTDLKLTANLDRKVSNKAHLPRISTASARGAAEERPSPIAEQGDRPVPTGAADAGAVDETITLADLPLLLELEQMHRSPELSQFVGERLVSDLAPGELAALRTMAVVYLDHSALRGVLPLDELIELAEAPKSPFWSKWFPPPGKKRGVFGVPLDVLVERSGTDSSLSWGQHTLRIPSVVDEIITAMKQQDVSVEGIFRKNGNIRLLNQLADELDRTSDPATLLQAHPPVQLAALLKKFLRQLPDPLLTHRLYRLFVRSQAVEPHSERLRLLQAIALLLPRAHRDTTEILFCFLRWVASFAHLTSDDGSKMDLPNLATVLAPNILYPKLPPAPPAAQVTDTSESFAANRAIGTMLVYQDAFWTVPPHLASALDLPNAAATTTTTDLRDLHRRCESWAIDHGVVPKSQRSAPPSIAAALGAGAGRSQAPAQAQAQAQGVQAQGVPQGNPLYPRPNPKRVSWTGVPSDGALSVSIPASASVPAVAAAGGAAMLPSVSAAPQLESPRS